MDFLSSYALQFVTWLKSHPNMAGLITFLISFGESLAIVGTIIPGSITMTAIGILIGSGVIPCYSTFLWAIVGAVCGDYVSYYIGYAYHQRIIGWWPLARHPMLIERGKLFFEQHGSKSVFFGRFLGPLRSIIPVIAGMMRMQQRDFLIANISSGILWSLAYIFPGVLIGSAASELSPTMATRILVLAIAVIALAWLSFYAVKHTLLFFKEQIGSSKTYLKQQLFNLSRGYPQLRNTLFVVIKYRTALWLALITAVFYTYSLSRVTHGWVTSFDIPLFHLVQSLHTHLLNTFFALISLSAEKYTVCISVALMILFLSYQRDYQSLRLLIGCLVSSAVSVYLLKHGFRVSRPPLLPLQPDLSYPSGHTTISFTVYGALAAISRKKLTVNQRTWLYKWVCVYFSLIGLSRIYLGAHWLSDVIGSMILSESILTCCCMLNRLTAPIHSSALQVINAGLVSILIASMLNLTFRHHHLLYIKQPIEQGGTQLRYQQWWGNPQLLPHVRSNRFGHPAMPLNVQWAMTESDIVQYLIDNNWSVVDHQPWAERIHHAFFDIQQPVALFQKLYHNRPPIIVAIKPPYILRLWHSGHRFIDQSQPLWLGTLSTLADERKGVFGKLNKCNTNKKIILYSIASKGVQYNLDLGYNGQIIQLRDIEVKE